MGTGSAGWKTIEHTADLAIEVEAPTLESLFTAAGLGLTGLLKGEESGKLKGTAPPGRVSQTIELEEADLEALLVEWLRDLLYFVSSRQLLFAGASFEALENCRLKALAYFVPTSVDAVQRELKGVTYHDLEVSWRNLGWVARIVFDV